VVDELAMPALDPHDPLGPGLTDPVAAALLDFLGRRTVELTQIGAELTPLAELATRLSAGGKRFRPAFCVWSFVAAGGEAADLPAAVRAAASLDLLHLGELVHDDVLDDSAIRRGMPAAHRWLAEDHREAGRIGDAEVFGRNGAILLGDLLQVWSVQLAQRCGLESPRLADACAFLELMRTEVTGGQFLDVLAGSQPWMSHPNEPDLAAAELEQALAMAARVVEYKSARYTVVRPCQFGAALAGGAADPDQLSQGLFRFGSPLGRAFQYRDDVLGVFGDPAVTGKPAGDDLREGKRTVLVAHAWAGTDRSGRAELASRLGTADLDADGVATLQQVVIDSGALAEVERMIDTLAAEADQALAQLELNPDGATALHRLAELAVRRTA